MFFFIFNYSNNKSNINSNKPKNSVHAQMDQNVRNCERYSHKHMIQMGIPWTEWFEHWWSPESGFEMLADICEWDQECKIYIKLFELETI